MLLVVQFAALLHPLAGDSRAGQIAASVISVGVLGAAVRMVHRSPRTGRVAAALSVLGVGPRCAHSGRLAARRRGGARVLRGGLPSTPPVR